MLVYLFLSCLYLRTASGYALFQRDAPELTDDAKEALKGAGIDLTKPYIKPKQVKLLQSFQILYSNA